MENKMFKIKHITWNDFGWKTHYHLCYIDSKGQQYDLGRMLIIDPDKAIQTYENEQPYMIDIESQFDKLPDNYISVGLGEEYYKKIYKYSLEIKGFVKIIENNLNDIALKGNSEKFKDESFYENSFTRHNSHYAIANIYKRIAEKGNEKFEYKLEFKYGWFKGELEINTKDSNILTDNIYGIIGRNGAGKTRLLNDIIKELMDENSSDSINDLLFISMSSFDKHDLISKKTLKYISIFEKPEEEVHANFKSRNKMIEEIYNSMKIISVNKEKTIDMEVLLELFNDEFGSDFLQVFVKLFEFAKKDKEYKEIATYDVKEIIDSFSSGQIYIFYVVIILCEKVEENMFAVIDEPELYLHPPFIMMYINLISYIFEKRNAIAIIATHSPIVIQQIPTECVYEIKRIGSENEIFLDKIDFPCYGENISLINDRIFKISSSGSGFYKDLSRLDLKQLKEVYEKNDIGIEAKMFIKIKMKELNNNE